MAKIADLRLKYRALMLAYRWRRVDPVPCATLSKPISDCRVALVTSAGLVPPGEEEFNQEARGGDFSYRLVPRGTDVQSLTESHRSDTFDHGGIEADKNLGLPLDRLEELATNGIIGEVAPRHLSFMGSITAPGRLVKQSAPEASALLVEDAVDIALLVPVWPYCHQTVGLVQAELERRGVVTASLTMMTEITRKVRPPRALEVPYPLGFPLGAAHDAPLQRRILAALLGILEHDDVPVLMHLSDDQAAL